MNFFEKYCTAEHIWSVIFVLTGAVQPTSHVKSDLVQRQLEFDLTDTAVLSVFIVYTLMGV